MIKLPNQQLLTSQQVSFLQAFNSNANITNLFKFSGGTALTTFYIPYRYSDDLDFFSEEIFEPADITSFIVSLKKRLEFIDYTFNTSFNRNMFFLKFTDGYELKTEFTYYPFSPIKPLLKSENIKVESEYDLAVNKLFTIYQNPRLRDFMDLYKLIKAFNFDFENIKRDAQIKFGTFIEPIQLGSQILKINTLEDHPKLITPLEINWKEFFLEKAKNIGESILV